MDDTAQLTGENLVLEGFNVVADNLLADRDGSGNGSIAVTAQSDATFNDTVKIGRAHV